MDLLSLINGLTLSDLIDTNEHKSSTVVDKLDFTKKEDLDRLLNAVDMFKTSDNGVIKLLKSIGGTEIDDLLDNTVTAAKKIYNDAHPQHKPVKNITRKEVDKSVTDEPVRPSSKIPEEVQGKINELVTEYLNTKIIPNAELTAKQITSIGDGLHEFACWIYSHD